LFNAGDGQSYELVRAVDKLPIALLQCISQSVRLLTPWSLILSKQSSKEISCYHTKIIPNRPRKACLMTVARLICFLSLLRS